MKRIVSIQGTGIREQGSGIRDLGSGVRGQGSGIRKTWSEEREDRDQGTASME
jgi:hypothetical protein